MENADSFDDPTIGEAPFEGRGIGGEFWQFIDEIEIEDMGAVEIGRTVGLAKIERIVSVVEQAKGALLVGRVGVGIRETHLQAMAHTFFHVGLQGVISGDACPSSSLIRAAGARV